MRLVKGVVLAGGTGSRLRPLTKLINKHLLPVGERPMIQYAIEKLSAAGVTDILLVTGKQSAGLYLEYLGSGGEFGVRMTYKIQERAGGIAQALGLAEGFIQPGESFVVLLGDNLFEEPLQPLLDAYREQNNAAMVFLKKVHDPERYGVPTLRDDRIVSIVEKPAAPASTYAVTGIYVYDSQVFDLIRELTPSGRGELEITDVNNGYAQKNQLGHKVMSGWWIDAGTHESLFQAALWIRREEE